MKRWLISFSIFSLVLLSARADTPPPPTIFGLKAPGCTGVIGAANPTLNCQATGVLSGNGSDGLSIDIGTPVVLGGDARISQLRASTSQNGYLGASDWNVFNNKQNALGYTPLNKAGDTMSGALNMGSNSIHNVTDPSSAQDAATKNYVDSHGTAPGGSTNSIQTNNGSGGFGGDSGFTYDGLTLTFNPGGNGPFIFSQPQNPLGVLNAGGSAHVCIGDCFSVNNGTYFTVDDINSSITFNGNLIFSTIHSALVGTDSSGKSINSGAGTDGSGNITATTLINSSAGVQLGAPSIGFSIAGSPTHYFGLGVTDTGYGLSYQGSDGQIRVIQFTPSNWNTSIDGQLLVYGGQAASGYAYFAMGNDVQTGIRPGATGTWYWLTQGATELTLNASGIESAHGFLSDNTGAGGPTTKPAIALNDGHGNTWGLGEPSFGSPALYDSNGQVFAYWNYQNGTMTVPGAALQLVQNGSTSETSIWWGGDFSTGIYHSANGEVDIASGGSQVLAINGTSVKIYTLLQLTPQGSGVTPTCGSTQAGTVAMTSTGILCSCISSAWVNSGTGLSCTF